MRLTLEEVTLNNSNREEFRHITDLLDQERKELIEYKTIEEELGIDLITLFKALKNGYFIEWFFEDKRYVRETSGGCLKCFRKEKISDYLDKHIWGLSIGNTVNYKLSDYGKTWALTKEELL